MAVSVASSTCFRVRDGVCYELLIPEQGLLLAELTPPDGASEYRLLPGWEHASYRVSNLQGELTLLAETLTPGVTWHLSPSVPGGHGGCCHTHGADGAALPAPVILLGRFLSPRYLLHAAYHEAAHALEPLLTPNEVECLDDRLFTSPAYGLEYEDSFEERLAEYFADFAMFLRAGGRAHGSPENLILGNMLDGEVGSRRTSRLTLRQKVCAPKTPASSLVATTLKNGLRSLGVLQDKWT